MRGKIINIGNAGGIILPEGMMQIEKDEIRIRKATTRDGWEEAAKRMRASDDDELLIPSVLDDEEVEW